MRITISVLCAIFLFGGIIESQAQKKKASKQEEQPAEPATPAPQPKPKTKVNSDSVFRHLQNKYALASRWSDSDIAKDVLYDMIILNPKNDSLIYNLAYYYFDNRQYASATLVSQELLARDSKNLDYLELSAASFEGLGILDRALQNYETQYLISNNIVTLYKIAFLQLELKRFEEGLTNVEILLSKPEASTIMIGFNDTKNNPKDFPMKYPVMNLKGLILEGKGDKAGARKMYEEIIKLAPDFAPAVTNLTELNKK